MQQLYDEQLVLQQIDSIRKYQPRCGGRKLFIMLQPFFAQHHIVMGRDIFFELLRRNKLLVRKIKPVRYPQTTFFRTGQYNYQLILGLTEFFYDEFTLHQQ